MIKKLLVALLAGLLLAACAPAVSPTTSVPGTHSLEPTAIAVVTPAPTPTLNDLLESCSLLDSHDLASFFTGHTEIVLPNPQIDQVQHPIFESGGAAGTETSCIYYSFHMPGSVDEVVLQVNYWLDLPASSTAESWSRDWSDASAQAQTLTGFGDGAFYEDGRLSLKSGGYYLTLEAVETDWDLKTPQGAAKQLALEKQLAQTMLGRLG